MNGRLEYRSYRRLFKEPVRTALGVWSVREGFVLRLEHDDGVVGFGEVAPIPSFGTETLEEAESFLSKFKVIDSAEELPDALPCCRFAISCARSILRRDFEPPKPTAEIAGLLPAGSLALNKLDELVSLGFRVFKWKVGVEAFQEERDLLDLLLEALPAGGALRLDANGNWNLMDAWNWLESLRGVTEIEFVEDPLEPNLWEAVGGLTDAFETDLALDLPVTPNLVPVFAKKAWSGLVTVKPSLMGSVENVLGIGRTFPEKVIFSSAFETAFGYEAILRLADGAKTTNRALGFGGQELFENDGLKLHQTSPVLGAGMVNFDLLEQAWEELP